jgi:hypothetical protein
MVSCLLSMKLIVIVNTQITQESVRSTQLPTNFHPGTAPVVPTQAARYMPSPVKAPVKVNLPPSSVTPTPVTGN